MTAAIVWMITAESSCKPCPAGVECSEGRVQRATAGFWLLKDLVLKNDDAYEVIGHFAVSFQHGDSASLSSDAAALQ